MKFGEVVEELRKERKYQKRIGNTDRTIGDEIVLIDVFLQECKEHYMKETASVGANNMTGILTSFKKIAANCIRAIQEYDGRT